MRTFRVVSCSDFAIRACDFAQVSATASLARLRQVLDAAGFACERLSPIHAGREVVLAAVAVAMWDKPRVWVPVLAGFAVGVISYALIAPAPES